MVKIVSDMEKVWLLLLLAISLPQSLTTSEGSCSKVILLLFIILIINIIIIIGISFIVIIIMLSSSLSDGHQDDPNCDEPLGSVMSEAAEKSKAIDEEVDDTDEVDGVFEPCRVS